jgi:hypothetical protein
MAESQMVHFLNLDEKYRDSGDDDYPSYPAGRSHSMGDYRFGRTQGKRPRVHARNALRHLGGYLKNKIEAIANAKHAVHVARVRAARHSPGPAE